MQSFLDFEQPIVELQAKIRELRFVGSDKEINLYDEIKRLEKKCEVLTKSIFSKLSPWQITQLARHPQRPNTTDYIAHLFTDFEELHGDRHMSNAAEIVGGIARLDEIPVIVLGHQKGKTTAEKIKRNFGMARPAGYRKALRLMKMAEKFGLPIITFIDTAGAYPGVEAEENNQSEAIARNLYEMAQLKTPIVTVVVGEGGSGGALAIGVADKTLMLQFSIYSVITPEGCASILWKDASRASDAAAILGLTADKLKELNLIDEIIPEPLGGAHQDMHLLMKHVKGAVCESLSFLMKYDKEELVAKRNEKILKIGRD